MAVPSVFISSVIRDFEAVRSSAAEAVRTMGMHPIVSEEAPANPASPRRALLDEVSRSDYYLLVLGQRYGEFGLGETSPTEQEYERAVFSNRPILVLVQDADLEPRQREFLERVRGDWSEGVLYARFTDEHDIGAHVAAALAKARSGIGEDAAGAQARALELAGREKTPGTISSEAVARIALVPAKATTLLDALALEDAALGDELAGLLRTAGVAGQAIAIGSQITASGVVLEGKSDSQRDAPSGVVHADGCIEVTASVAQPDAPMGFGGSVIDPDQLAEFVQAAAGFAQLTWDRIDRDGEVGQVAIALAIPDAEYKGFGRVSGSSMSIPMQLPRYVVAPDPAIVVPRGQVASDGVVRRLVAELHRVFADAGALIS